MQPRPENASEKDALVANNIFWKFMVLIDMLKHELCQLGSIIVGSTQNQMNHGH